jgi:hypothetical protein
MIRSRLVGALRRQDWMAVVIELLTVVLGLFLGLQLNEWNDARKAHSREQADLVRLEQESEADVSMFRRFVARFDQINADQEAAIGALSTGDKTKFNAHELASAIGSLQIYPGIAPPRAVYDELSNSGQFSDIGSPSVRSAVADYYSELSFIQSQLDYFRQGTSAEIAHSEVGQSSTFNPNASTIQEHFIYTANFDTIAGNRAYMTQLVNDLRNQLMFQHYRRRVAAKAEAMCKALAEALHKACAAAMANTSSVGSRARLGGAVMRPDSIKTIP